MFISLSSTGRRLLGDRALGLRASGEVGRKGIPACGTAAHLEARGLGRRPPRAHRQGQSNGGKSLPNSNTPQTTQEHLQ